MSRTVSKPMDPFAGDGQVKALCRQMDWSATSLGPVADWSPTLRRTVRTCLDSPFPINLWCGPELVLIYNDAYTHILGVKHPTALGRPGREAWGEIWPDIEPMFQQIREGGPPVFQEDAPFTVVRDHATLPEAPNAWYTFALSGVRDDDGEIVCFLNIASETTSRMMAERATEAARATAERAEARLRDVFTQAPTFLAVLRGPEHVFEYVNDAYYLLVGTRELLGRPALEALPEVRGQGYSQLLDQVFETGEAYTGREMEISLALTPGADPVQRFVDFVQEPENQEKVLEFGFRPGNPDVPVGAPIDAAHGVDPGQPQTLLEVPSPGVLARLLEDWEDDVGRFVKVMPRDYKRVLEAAEKARTQGIDVDEAIMASASLDKD